VIISSVGNLEMVRVDVCKAQSGWGPLNPGD
jgi:hypothetical protein